MSVKLVSRPFTAGEISPQLFGRTDLQVYQQALALCENFFVDYRGGISTRPGSEFVDYVKDDDQDTKFVPFRFAPNLANTYMVLFGHQYVRFIQDGAYVLEAAQNIEGITQANPGVVTITGHGYTSGDWVIIADVGGMTRLNGQSTFEITVLTADTFSLQDPFGNNYDTSGLPAYTSGGTVSRIYTVTSPYDADDLGELKVDQIRDTLRLTHPDFTIRNLTRSGATSWAFTAENLRDFGTAPAAPTVTINHASGGTESGSAEAIYCITAVDVDGKESLPSPITLKTGMAMYIDDVELTAEITWAVVSGAMFYRVYRSRVVNHAGGMTKGDFVGLIGETVGTKFTDGDEVPDFTQTPPEYGNPFAHGAVEYIEVTAGGSGYAVNDTVSVSGGGGSGFRGELIVVGGVIKGIKVIDPGSGYSGASVSITTAAGTGATFSVTLTEATGNNPHASAVFQQRQAYAATDNDPLGLFGSRVGRLSNFSTSAALNDADAFEYELESAVVAAIRHLVPTTGGLAALAKDGIWLISGGQEPAVTPTNVLAEHIPSAGAADVPPLLVNSAILYVEDGFRAVRLLALGTANQEVGGQDMSILATHLIKPSNPITHWAFASSPYYLVWARRQDGTFLAFTLQREHGVFGWTRQSTAGLVEDIAAVEESDEHAVYLMVKRYVNGRWTKFIERLASREFTDVEDAWCVDCGLKTESTFPAAILTPGAATGTGITFTASASVFVIGDVGKVIRGGGGKAVITGFTSGTEITVTIQRDFTKLVPQTGRPVPIPSGEWSMDATFSTVSGLDHLEGETVKVLLDGKVLEDKTVAAGAISLGTTGSRAIVGMGFRALARTLPIGGADPPIDDKRKRIVGTAVRLHETAGLKVGDRLADLYEFQEMLSDNYNTAIELLSEFELGLIKNVWDENGQTYFVQDFPLPATILGAVLDMEIGDDTD